MIVATQVLESMTIEARPTRAEVNDAANAVEDGVDAIMLAGETAAGAFPARAVQTLDAIIRDAETAPRAGALRVARSPAHDDHAQALCEAAVTLADRGDAQAIVAVTRGGATARRLSALRPHAPIIAATERSETARRLALLLGRGAASACRHRREPRRGERADRRSSSSSAASSLPARPSCFVSISADLTRSDANYLKIQRL